jgi:hypothetical protein
MDDALQYLRRRAVQQQCSSYKTLCGLNNECDNNQKIKKHLILDDTRSMRSTQGRRPPTNDYEDVDIDNESQRT